MFVTCLPRPRQQDLLDAVQRSLTRDRIVREEREVMNLVVSGMLNKQNSAELDASEPPSKCIGAEAAVRAVAERRPPGERAQRLEESEAAKDVYC